MKAGSRPQYYRIRRMVQMVREGAKSGYLPNSGGGHQIDVGSVGLSAGGSQAGEDFPCAGAPGGFVTAGEFAGDDRGAQYSCVAVSAPTLRSNRLGLARTFHKPSAATTDVTAPQSLLFSGDLRGFQHTVDRQTAKRS